MTHYYPLPLYGYTDNSSLRMSAAVHTQDNTGARYPILLYIIVAFLKLDP